MSAIPGPKKDMSLVERVAAAVLYEGYVLYPYRPSSVKNQQRWNFGVVCPESYSVAQNGTEVSEIRTECLLAAGAKTRLTIKVKFLQLISREISSAERETQDQNENFKVVNSLEHDGRLYNTWQEATEREVGPIVIEFGKTGPMERSLAFDLKAKLEVEELRTTENGSVTGLITRRQNALSGIVEVGVNAKVGGFFKVSVLVKNTTPFENAHEVSRDQALMNSFVSTHTILTVDKGEFISLLDPPTEVSELTADCENKGTYPVLVGVEGAKDCMLSSPIILYDYPQIAEDSPGDLFDGTEIDEILTLRILTLTDDEKREMRESDERARQLLERTEMLPLEQFMKLHGVMKGVNRK